MTNNQNTQVATYTPQVLEAFDPQVLQVIRTSFCPTATDAEFLLFAHKAASYGLDPFKNEIFFIKYGNQVRIQFAAEAYLSKAREKEGFEPPHTQVVREGDRYKARWNHKEREMEIEYESDDDNPGKIIRAYSIAYRTGYRPVTVIVEMKELEHMMTGQNKDNWTKWTADMIGKFAEQRALKKQYGLDLNEDEVPQQTVSHEPIRHDITAEAEQMKAAQQQAPSSSQQSNKAKATESDADKMEKAKFMMMEKFEYLGVPEAERGEYVKARVQMKGQKMDLAEINNLLKIMDMEIAEKAARDDDLLEA